MRRQQTYNPPAGRPGWSSPSPTEFDLLYLAWGWRRYGQTPQIPMRRNGWLYFTTTSGHPSLITPESARRSTRIDPQTFVILHPDCLCGWEDVPGAKSDVCTWVWKDAPRWAPLVPRAAGMLRFQLDASSWQKIHEIHLETRSEIQNSDCYTSVALKALHTQIDLLLTRSLSTSPRPATNEQRVKLACHWIKQHLNNHTPVTGLSDYLQLSGTTLNRLFQQQLGINVRSYAKSQRIEHAKALISTGVSVKAAAYALGYHHPNDLSRAMH